MEVFEAVRTVLAVREFQDKPVPPDAARRIVAQPGARPGEAAWLAGPTTLVSSLSIHFWPQSRHV